MTTTRMRRKGAPLVALAAVLAVWIALRVTLWHSPFDTPDEAAGDAGPVRLAGPELASPKSNDRQAAEPAAEAAPTPRIASASYQVQRDVLERDPVGMQASARATDAVSSHVQAAIASPAFKPEVPRKPVASSVQNSVAAQPPAKGHTVSRPIFARAASKPEKRWSFDGWAFIRSEGGLPNAAGVLAPSYGGSQVGAVMRYRLDPQSGHKPAAYARVTKAISQGEEGDIALGAAARPVPQIPVALHAEARLSRNAGGTEVRPAVFAVTELPPAQLPFGLRAEAYVQAGYVGGDFETAFADGQARLDHELAQVGGAELRLGAGVWGGAQKGAQRLDAGPGISASFNLDKAPVRLSMDYRHRVAGDAQPDSGVAVTISTGF